MDNIKQLLNDLNNLKDQELILNNLLNLYQYKMYFIKNNNYNRKIKIRINKAIHKYKNKLKNA